MPQRLYAINSGLNVKKTITENTQRIKLSSRRELYEYVFRGGGGGLTISLLKLVFHLHSLTTGSRLTV